jgi:CheY-like chemotaxis protein
MVFEGEGYDVTTAQSSAEALGILRDERSFDAVITDLNMEKEDIGLDVAQAALTRRPKPVVVVCTGYASVNNAMSALNMGVDYMAHKPVELESLISAMNRLILSKN